MRLSRLRFALSGLMVLVAVAALASLAASKVCRDYPGSKQRVVVLVVSVVAAAYGLGSVRRPWIFLIPVFIFWLVGPRVDHPGINLHDQFPASCFLGWIIGAPVGWISRSLASPVPPSKPPPPDLE